MYEFREHYHKCKELSSLLSGTSIMAWTATTIPCIQSRLTMFLNQPVVLKSSLNHPNIYLTAQPYNFKKSDGPSKLFSIDHHDFSDFFNKVHALAGGEECTILYTDFVNM